MPVRFAFLTDTHHYPVASKLMARAVRVGGAAMMLVRRRLRGSQRQQAVRAAVYAGSPASAAGGGRFAFDSQG